MFEYSEKLVFYYTLKNTEPEQFQFVLHKKLSQGRQIFLHKELFHPYIPCYCWLFPKQDMDSLMFL